MASWILVPCLVSLRNEFNLLAPKRNTESDGSIGDTRHAGEASDHNPDETGNTPSKDADSINEVHAIDVDKDLNRPGITMGMALSIIVARHKNGQDNRLQNIIYNRSIASRSWGWEWHDYTGSNPHDKHAHFSARYTTAQENDTRPWGLMGVSVPQKEWAMQPIVGYGLPLIRYGDDDKNFEGWNMIERIQRQIGVEDDGIFGPGTLAALIKWFPDNDCKSISVEMYSKLFGISYIKR